MLRILMVLLRLFCVVCLVRCCCVYFGLCDLLACVCCFGWGLMLYVGWGFWWYCL